jgi:hypothetical protein
LCCFFLLAEGILLSDRENKGNLSNSCGIKSSKNVVFGNVDRYLERWSEMGKAFNELLRDKCLMIQMVSFEASEELENVVGIFF